MMAPPAPPLARASVASTQPTPPTRNGKAARLHRPPNHRRIRALAVPRAVQVHHVQTLRTLRRPVARHLGGIVRIARLSGEITLDQANAAPATDVNGGNRREH